MKKGKETNMNMDITLSEQDQLQNEWREILADYPPVMTPKEVQKASKGIIKVNDVYLRKHADGKKLDLDIRLIAGRVYVTRRSVVAALSGRQELPL